MTSRNAFQCGEDIHGVHISHEQQVDKIFLWLDGCNQNKIKRVIEELVKNCSLTCKSFILTILEPLLHRDYIYHKFDTNSKSSFSSLSTFVSRELRTKHEKDITGCYKRNNKNIHRLKSAHIINQEDAKQWSIESVFPNMKSIDYDNHHQTADISVPKHACNIWINPAVSKFCQSSVDLISLPNMKSRKCLCKYASPLPNSIASTDGQMSRLHQFPTIKTAPARLKVEKSEKHERLFKDFPLSFQTTKRHMQIKKDDQFEFLQSCKSYKSRSLPAVLRKPVVLKTTPKKPTFIDRLSKLLDWFSTLTVRQQEEFFQTLLKLLSPTQLYFVYASLSVYLYCDFTYKLPVDVSIKIFSYLHPKALIACSQVSRRWKEISNVEYLWENIFRKKKLETHSIIGYKYDYLFYKKTKHCWNEGKYSICDLQKHTGSVTALHLYNDFLATGSTDKSIRIWRIDQTRCIAVLEGHQKSIWGVQFISSTLICSCSNDQTIKIWNIRNSNCARTIIAAHEGAVWCIQVKGKYLASGGADKTAKIWNLRNLSLYHSFTTNGGGVHSLVIDDKENILYAGGTERIVYIWNINMKYCMNIVQLCCMKTSTFSISSLSFHKGFLLCACGPSYELWDITKNKLVNRIEQAHQEKIECLHLVVLKEKKCKEDIRKGRIVTASKDGKIKVWNLQRSRSLYTLPLCEDSINCIQIGNEKLVCGLQDASVKVLTFNTT